MIRRQGGAHRRRKKPASPVSSERVVRCPFGPRGSVEPGAATPPQSIDRSTHARALPGGRPTTQIIGSPERHLIEDLGDRGGAHAAQRAPPKAAGVGARKEEVACAERAKRTSMGRTPRQSQTQKKRTSHFRGSTVPFQYIFGITTRRSARLGSSSADLPGHARLRLPIHSCSSNPTTLHIPPSNNTTSIVHRGMEPPPPP